MHLYWKRNLVILWIGVLFCSMAYSVSIPFLPIFLNTEMGVNDHLELWSGIAFGVTFLASALIAPFWGSLEEKTGYALGIMATAGATGSIIGPLNGGMLGSWVPIRWIFVLNGGILLLAALLLGGEGEKRVPGFSQEERHGSGYSFCRIGE